MEMTVQFIGKTKDGRYATEKTFELNQHPDLESNILDATHIITENGYVDITVELDKEGRLLAVQVERTNIGV